MILSQWKIQLIKILHVILEPLFWFRENSFYRSWEKSAMKMERFDIRWDVGQDSELQKAAQEYFNCADLACFSKAVCNGMPISF